MFCRYFQVVSQVSEWSFCFDVIVPYSSEIFWIIKIRVESIKSNYIITNDYLRRFTFPKIFLDLNFKISFCPDNKICRMPIYFLQPRKIHIASIKYVISAMFIGDYIHRIHIMNRCRCYMDKRWNLSSNII